jgi:aminoglycoside 3-N-acetyltransferase
MSPMRCVDHRSSSHARCPGSRLAQRGLVETAVERALLRCVATPGSGPPVTISSLTAGLRNLGLSRGDTVLVHSSLRSFGYVCGGATAVVQALLAVVGPHGTIVAPTQTPESRDPARWTHVRVPEEWWQSLRAELPPFDPAITPSATGVISERIRTWPGAVRSAHPITSFAAVGPLAHDLMAIHELTSMLGERSPLASLERVGAKALLLGVGFDTCTAFHLAEYRQPRPTRRKLACLVNGTYGRSWTELETIDLDASDFGRLGADFESRTGLVCRTLIGCAECRAVPVREAVGFAVQWLGTHRRGQRG